MHEPNEFGVPTHAHSHTEAHSHSHPHVHESKKNVVNRLARAIGHLEKVKRMVEDDCDCAEVLIQIAAVRAAIENTGKVILQDHIQHCTPWCSSACAKAAVQHKKRPPRRKLCPDPLAHSGQRVYTKESYS